jgi:hypothetical protein
MTFAKVIGPFCDTGKEIGIDALKGGLVGVAEGATDGGLVGVAEGATDGVGTGAVAGLTIVVPLSHTNFFPDLTQVNFVVAVELVAPNFVQATPAAGEAAEA